MTDRPQDAPEESAEVSEETAAGSFGEAAAEMANETEIEGGEDEAAGPPVEQQLAERTADHQRLQAEYLNYKRRVERDREDAGGTDVREKLPGIGIASLVGERRRRRDHAIDEAGRDAPADLLERCRSQIDLHVLSR